MHTNLKIFQPNPIEGAEHEGSSALDFATPRGLFRSEKGIRYVVCDHPKRRFAIALDHPDYEPFTYLPLRGKPVDIGRWVGVGTFRLDRLLNYEGNTMSTGTLLIGEGAVSLLVQDRRERYSFQKVARGFGGRPDWAYERWTLPANGERFFRYRDGQHPPFIAWK